MGTTRPTFPSHGDQQARVSQGDALEGSAFRRRAPTAPRRPMNRKQRASGIIAL
ncbi:MAG: hypothetical protein R2770_16815 [Acidimicrobiales bacterium]